MELFGDRLDFAIEAGVEPELVRPSAVWGHMCVWCAGHRLGDPEDRHSGLYDAVAGFQDVAASLERLWDESLVGLDDHALFDHFDVLLYGCRGAAIVADDRTVEECRRDAGVWFRFNFLTNWGEPFDGCKAFVVVPPVGPLRVLFRGPTDGSVVGANVSVEGFLAATSDFLRWYEDQERRLKACPDDWQSFDPSRLVELARQQHPDQPWLAESLRHCNRCLVESPSLVRFVTADNANQPGAEWQFRETLELVDPEDGRLLLDILIDGRVGAIEYYDCLFHEQARGGRR